MILESSLIWRTSVKLLKWTTKNSARETSSIYIRKQTNTVLKNFIKNIIKTKDKTFYRNVCKLILYCSICCTYKTFYCDTALYIFFQSIPITLTNLLISTVQFQLSYANISIESIDLLKVFQVTEAYWRLINFPPKNPVLLSRW